MRYEIEGSWDLNDPVHETLTLFTLRAALKRILARNMNDLDNQILGDLHPMVLPANSKYISRYEFKPKAVPATTSEFIRGVIWPDDPKCYLFTCDRGLSNYSDGVLWAAEFKALGTPRHTQLSLNQMLIARSHFGDLQFLHAMATKPGEAPQKTRQKVLEWARFNIEIASGRIDPDTPLKDIKNIPIIQESFVNFRPLPVKQGLSAQRIFGAVIEAYMHGSALAATGHLKAPSEILNYAGASFGEWSTRSLLSGGVNRGKKLSNIDIRRRSTGILLHLIQDSFAEGHTEREPGYGPIRQFHDYGAQDPHKHSSKDSMGEGKTTKEQIDLIPGAAKAIEAGAYLVAMLEETATPDRIMNHLENNVFKLSKNAKPAGPGDSFKKP
ncbi:hypothetical protein HI113_27645 [Corallococcus exiguus]|uniref:hypothetical protein n=1 Tax=Corallococcus exiguus TaxID=83462 RepID=UPI0014763DD7|nr:hypothetical protein [Corallococcus exiguus]NNB97678.1 hypothetical protein [Corallococcus exiguus]